ncbi:hypothetical protein CPLU01_15403 [Colletotrichum plurivorum]|uniref:Methyltransferase domain-containing protein n=1 Tax=Colletotrichum plurivorum TaxID=2175906 RepID=A0A8H6MUZ7_9PEZI|nr:hypothetical protein CPLU01_15403 [Colletotrichum plurivorum]
MSSKARWPPLGVLLFVLPVAVLYLLTSDLDKKWKASTPTRDGDRNADDLARAALSEASWLRSVQRRHEWMEKNSDYDATLFSPRDDSFRFWYTLWDLFPATYTCPWDVQRIGRLGDGGKWICGMSRYEGHVGRPLRVYSFGVGGDSSFEEEFLDRVPGAQVWGFDDSVDGWGRGLRNRYANRTHFSKTAVAGEDFLDQSDGTRFLSIKSLMREFGHEYVDLVKMDIEGDEFPTLEAFLKEFRVGDGENGEGEEVPMGQIVVEIHVPDKGPRISQFREWWERIEEVGFRPVMGEANLLAVTVGDGKPCCVEVSSPLRES